MNTAAATICIEGREYKLISVGSGRVADLERVLLTKFEPVTIKFEVVRSEALDAFIDACRSAGDALLARATPKTKPNPLPGRRRAEWKRNPLERYAR